MTATSQSNPIPRSTDRVGTKQGSIHDRDLYRRRTGDRPVVESVIFDLDDTLYNEMTFVIGAFTEVAVFLAQRTGLEAKTLLDHLLMIERRDGRGQVFETLLASYSLNPKWAKAMLATYRSAVPPLSFFADTTALLTSLSAAGIPTAVVTDGYGLVQANKAAGLHLDTHVDAIVYTDSLGHGGAKPGTAGFETALAMIGSEESTSAYVGNDVTKDFIGPRQLGMQSVLINRKTIGRVEDQPAFAHPDHIVPTLSDLPRVLKFKSPLDRRTA